jgi:hypothetical protein
VFLSLIALKAMGSIVGEIAIAESDIEVGELLAPVSSMSLVDDLVRVDVISVVHLQI